MRSAKDWNQLLQYYGDCLVIENREQYIVDGDKVHWVQASAADIHRLMMGEADQTFPKRHQRRQTGIASFLLKPHKDTIKRVCLGFPMLTLDGGTIAPLLYCPLTLEEEEDQLVLKAEDLEVSYAALAHFGFKEEEIARFLALLADGEEGEARLPLATVQQRLIEAISELLQFELKWSDKPIPHTLRTQSGLFWVDSSIATGNLIKELRALGASAYWDQAPRGLRTLLSISADHEYPGPSVASDGVYITPVNEGQIAAAAAAASEPLTVVTGPPGTGKSQLVLNLIANAFLRGEKCLFASRNNGAVDVVMNRLQGEMGFQGAIRTGNNEVRRKAALQIEAALNAMAMSGAVEPIADTRAAYEAARAASTTAQAQLERVKDLSGLLQSQQAERDDWLGQLPQWLAKIAPDTVPAYKTMEVERLQNQIQEHLNGIRTLRERQRHLGKTLEQLVVLNTANDPLVASVQQRSRPMGFVRG